jgi:broad specificity phosphatase PhoE
MGEGLTLDRKIAEYRGATAPGSHRLLLSSLKAVLTLFAARMGVKALRSTSGAFPRKRHDLKNHIYQSRSNAGIATGCISYRRSIGGARDRQGAVNGLEGAESSADFIAPERRAQMTALSLNLSASIAEDLSDCDFGSWRGRALSQVQNDDPAGLFSWLTDPAVAPHGGESIEALFGRVKGWLDRQRDAGHTIAVTHPSIIRSAIILALNAPLQSFWRVDIAPASLTDLRYNGSTWILRSAAAKLSHAE